MGAANPLPSNGRLARKWGRLFLPIARASPAGCKRRGFFLKTKMPILITIACAITSIGLLSASAKPPTDDLILAKKNSQDLDYAGDFPSPDDIEMWKFFDKGKFPVFMPAGCDLETMTHIAWSQRMLISLGKGQRVSKMSFRFRKRISLGKFLRVKLSKSGASLSIGKPGMTVNVGHRRGTRATVGIPGSGVSYQTRLGKRRASCRPIAVHDRDRGRGGHRVSLLDILALNRRPIQPI